MSIQTLSAAAFDRVQTVAVEASRVAQAQADNAKGSFSRVLSAKSHKEMADAAQDAAKASFALCVDWAAFLAKNADDAFKASFRPFAAKIR